MKQHNEQETVNVHELTLVAEDGTIFFTGSKYKELYTKDIQRGNQNYLKVDFDLLTKHEDFLTYEQCFNEDGTPELNEDGEEVYVAVPYDIKVTGEFCCNFVLKDNDYIEVEIFDQPSIPIHSYSVEATRTNLGRLVTDHVRKGIRFFPKDLTHEETSGIPKHKHRADTFNIHKRRKLRQKTKAAKQARKNNR